MYKQWACWSFALNMVRSSSVLWCLLFFYLRLSSWNVFMISDSLCLGKTITLLPWIILCSITVISKWFLYIFSFKIVFPADTSSSVFCYLLSLSASLKFSVSPSFCVALDFSLSSTSVCWDFSVFFQLIHFAMLKFPNLLIFGFIHAVFSIYLSYMFLETSTSTVLFFISATSSIPFWESVPVWFYLVNTTWYWCF